MRLLTLAGADGIGVIAAGEAWPDGSLRRAIEDRLGAGAILDALDLPGDAEADLARASFRAARGDLARRVGESLSGRELAARGFGCDVEIATALDVSDCAPVLRAGAFR